MKATLRKALALTASVLMLCSLLPVGAIVSAAETMQTLRLNGFDTWTQSELDTSSGNNGYANGCCTKLTVVTDSQYIVGGGRQAIKAVKGSSQNYNNCIVNWTYGTGGPCTAGNVWAPANGGTVNYADYDGIRVAVLNANGQPANFTRVTFRVTEGKNYSNNMRYWDGTIDRDSEGYFYFDFASFQSAGSPAGTNLYDYLTNYAKGISMLCYGGSAEDTCYYSAVELYKNRTPSTVNKNDLRQAIASLEALDATKYADQLAAAKAVLNSDEASQADVDAQTAIINGCIEAYYLAQSTGYSYVQLDGIQNWTAEEAAAMNGFGSTYSISDKGLVGDATQSLKMTATGSNTRFCFATQKSGSAGFSTLNPFSVTNAADGKLSDYEGIAIAFSDENGDEIEIDKFVARLMRNATDWGSYWSYEATYTDIDAIYANGYYHLKFSDYPNLNGVIDDLAIMSVLFYKNVASGETAYISDMKAYTYEEPEVIEYEYLQLDGVQKWTAAHLAQTSANNGHLNSVTATYSISNLQLVGAATQSIKAVKSSATASFNCLVNKAYDSNGIACPSPWLPADGVSNVSDYDGVMIAVRDANGNVPQCSEIRLRVLSNPASNGWGTYQQSNTYTVSEDGYLVFPFEDFPNHEAVKGAIDDAQGISFLLSDSGVTEYYFSDFKAYRVKSDVDTSALEEAIASLKNLDTTNIYAEEIASAEALLADREATQEQVDAMAAQLREILRALAIGPVDFDEDNVVLSFGAISDTHMNASTTDNAAKKYRKALQVLKEISGGNLDALTIAGDLSASTYSDGIMDAYLSINADELDESVRHFYITGNHDAQDNDYASINSFYNKFSGYFEDYATDSSDFARGNHHTLINGYHFIGVNTMDYWNANEARLETEDLEWLEAELAAARADKPGQPIFVYMHAPVYGTTYGSDLYTGKYWGSKNVYDYLKDYPEVVTFGGHVHFPLMDERSIYQKDFTSLNTGSVGYMAIESGYVETGSKTTINESHDISSGLLVQIDKNHNLKITRINFSAGEAIKQPYIIPAPDMENETNLLYYNDEYLTANNTAPAFPADGTVTGAYGAAGQHMLSLEFPAALDNDMVHHYVIKVSGQNSAGASTYKTLSQFYNYSSPADMPDSLNRLLTFIPGSDSTYNVEITAVDSAGAVSQPLTGTFEVEQTGTQVTNLAVNGGFESGDFTGWSKYQSSVVSTAAAMNGNYGANLKGGGTYGGMLNQSIPVTAGKTYQVSFWIKVNQNGVNVQLKDGNDSGASLITAGGWMDYNSHSSWTQKSFIVTPQTNKIFLNFCGAGNGTDTDSYLDDVLCTELKEASFDGYITNGDFETGKTDGWEAVWNSIQVTLTSGRNSGYAASLTSSNKWQVFRQKGGVAVEPNTDYVVQVYAKNANGMNILVKDGADENNIAQAKLQGTNDWALTTLTFNSGNQTRVHVGVMSDDANNTVIIDDFMMFKKVEPSNDGYIVNGTFETGNIDPWVNLWGSCPTAEVIAGGKDSAFALNVVSGQWKHVRQTGIAVKANTNYKITAWAKNANNMNLLVKDGGDSVDIKTVAVNAGSEWTQFTVEFNTGEYTSIIFSLMGGAGSDQYGVFDNIVMEEVHTHNYVGTVTTPATCGAEGVMTYACTCGEGTYTEAIPATGEHVYDNDYDADCNVCGDIREVAMPITTGGSSVSEDVSGLAVKFEVAATGFDVVNNTEAVYDDAKLGEYSILRMGAVVSNSNGEKDVHAKYLCDLSEDSVAFAVRVINIPEEFYDVEITYAPYIVIELDGVETTIWGEAETVSCNGANQ